MENWEKTDSLRREQWRLSLERQHKIEEIFHQAKAREWNRRTAFLIRVCGDDQQLIDDVEYWFRATTLAELLAISPLEPSRFFEIACGVCVELDFVHRCGTVHGDLNPANVLVFRSGIYRLLHFRTDASLDSGQDIRALGMVLREMLSTTTASPELMRIVEKACHPDSTMRYNTVLGVFRDLSRLGDKLHKASTRAPARKAFYRLLDFLHSFRTGAHNR